MSDSEPNTKKPGRIKRFFLWWIHLYTDLDRRGRQYFGTATAAYAAAILLYVFEPFSPWYAPVFFVALGLGIGMSIAVGHKRGFPILSHMWQWMKRHRILTTGVFLFFVLLFTCLWLVPLGRSPFKGMNEAQLTDKVNADYQSLTRAIFQLDTVMRGLRANRALFELDDLSNLSMDDRDRIMELWADFSGHLIFYNSLVDQYRYFYRIYYFNHKKLHNQAFLTGYAAVVTLYLSGSELIDMVNSNKLWETILDEQNRDLGIPAGMYSLLKNRIISFDDVARLTAGFAHLQFLTKLDDGVFLDREGEMQDYVHMAFKKCARRLALKSAVWFPKDSIDAFKARTFSVWFPVQKAAAGVTGNVRFTSRRDNYIRNEHLVQLDAMLNPGDILVERRNWYLSNVGIPGFWPHAALYLGRRAKFLAYFEDDPEVQALVGEAGIEAYIQTERPRLWKDFKDEIAVIEAVSPGVVLHTLEQSAGADYTGAMRPRLSKKDTFLAILTAFSHYGKPYDYNFDFITDSSLVCTELVYKAYLGGEHKKGLTFPLTKHAGRDLCTAQQMVEAFDQDYEPEETRQLEFVAFLDYDEEEGEIYFADLKTFRASAERPKWSVLLE